MSNINEVVDEWFKAVLAGRTAEADAIEAGALSPEHARVDATRDTVFTTYDIYGHPAAVSDVVQALLERYPPAGYGTRIVSKGVVGNDTRVVVRRANSCE